MLPRKRVPYVSQLGSMDCGVACLTMLFNYYGVKVDIVDIGADIHVGRDGVSIAVLKKISEKYGFKFAVYKYEYNQKNMDLNLPSILFNGSHYIIVEKKKRANQYVIIDPAKGRRVIEYGDIKRLYTDILIFITPQVIIKELPRKKMDIQIKKAPLIIAAFFMLLMQLITLTVPIIVQKVIDGLSGRYEFDAIRILGVITLVGITYLGLSWIRQALLLNIDMKLYKSMISKMINKLFKVEINFFEWHAAGDIGNRFSNISQLNDLITNGFSNIAIQGMTSLICLFAMLYSSVGLTIFTLLIATLQIILMVTINRKGLVKTREYIFKQSVLQSDLIETLGNIVEIKCMGMDEVINKNLKEKYDGLIVSFKDKTKLSNLMNCFNATIGLVFPLSVYLIGSFYVSNKEMSIGSLIAFVTLAGYFSSPFTSIIMLLPSINSIKEIMLRYKELMSFRENSDTGEKVEGPLEKINIQNISYSYNRVTTTAINNISMEIRKGENIALIGLSGSGKSTLIKVLLGAVRINQGNIYFNNIDINEISREQVYNWFSIVTQNPMCLNGNIRKNVDITGKFSDGEIWRALEISEVKEDIEDMPLGLDTMIGEGGQNISGGQRQRLAIARALISNTEVIIFDEATSNLDPITERKIYENLKKCDKTRITITHRLASIQDADKIYVMNRGQLIESGTHEELLKHKGWYYESINNTSKYIGEELNHLL